MSSYTNLSAANAVSADRFLNSVVMKVGAYTLDETTIATSGARHINITHTTDTTTDTLGTVTVVGLDLSGRTISETITPVADSLVAGAAWFASVISATGAGWVQAGGVSDTIEIGYGAELCVLQGAGQFESIIVNTTAAATIVIADAGGTIATLAASITEGHYEYGLNVCDLTVDLNGASDVTIVHSTSRPSSYAME